MKKLTVLLAVMLIAMGATAYATQTRTMTMGNNDGIMVDDYNMMRFYGRTLNYPNIVTGEFYNDRLYYSKEKDADGYAPYYSFYNLGVNWEFNEDNPWVLGTYISTEMPYRPVDFDGSNLTYSGLGQLGDNHRIQLLYGRKLSNMNFGFMLDYNNASYKREDSTNKLDQSFSYYRFGAGLSEATSGQWDVAVTFGIGTWTDKNTQDSTVSKPDGFYDLTAEGRYFWVQNPKITFVPHVMVAMAKRGATYPLNSSDSARSQTMTNLGAGIGMQYVTGPDLLAVIDFGIDYYKLKEKFTNSADTTSENNFTSIYLPYIQVGFEGSVFDWMDVRLGARTYWTIDKQKDLPLGNYKDNYADNETYLGFGFHFGRLHVDTYANPQLFLDGFNFISGQGANDGYDAMNFKISALYEMF